MLPVLGLDPGIVSRRLPAQLPGGGGPVGPHVLQVAGAHVAADCTRPDGAVPALRLAAAAAGRRGVLHDGRVVGEAALQPGHGLRRLAHADVLDVGAAEDDVLVHLVPGSHRLVRGSVLGTE